MSPIGHDSQFDVVHTIKGLRARVDTWRANGLTVGFVPTMGALHEGHLSLVETALGLADRTVASIFVNPAQFAAHEDLSTYPRNEARDLDMLRAAGCDLVYLPSPEEIYPPGFQTSVKVAALSQGLCGDSRPHFFGGVATVVCKLLNQCRPDVAVFGEKDFQQLLIIRRMARDLDMAVEIVGAPIVREADGLAMSSRNAYLTKAERAVAGQINQVLAQAAEDLLRAKNIENALRIARESLNRAGVTSIDYLELRSEEDLSPINDGPLASDVTVRLFVAVIVGKTRLIDNMPVRAEP